MRQKQQLLLYERRCFARADQQRLLATSNSFLPESLAVELNFVCPVGP